MTLTPREQAVLELTWAELSIKEQAERLGIAQATVKLHRLHLKHKAGSRTMIGVVKWALTHNILTVSPSQTTDRSSLNP